MAEERAVVKDGEEEEELLREEGGVSLLDFDVLCSSVAAMQTQRNYKWAKLHNQEEEEDYECGNNGGVLRMWEGDVIDYFDHPPIALQSACCPCYRFGKNMKRAGFGLCYIQAIVYMILAATALISMIAFIVTGRHCFLYMGVAFTISLGAHMGFHRMQIRKKFNIRGTDSLLDDCFYHLICPCCTLSQESRTLEMNNVQDGTWHGRGDTICVGDYNEGRSIFELRAPPLISINSSEPSTTMITRTPDHRHSATLLGSQSR